MTDAPSPWNQPYHGKISNELQEILDQARFAKSCCDSPDDRLYHAADKTWWKRVGHEWKAAEAPVGWVSQ